MLVSNYIMTIGESVKTNKHINHINACCFQ